MQIPSKIKQYKKLIIVVLSLLIIVPLALMAVCYCMISPYQKLVVSPQDARHIPTGIVLGAGITKDGKPFKELQARLDSAADAINNGMVEKLILSGDNRFKYYDEPTAMKQYLVEQRGIALEKLIPDYAGRSTYESCERAAKIFGVTETIIFSAGSHLPRAIYLCEHFNIKALGIASGVEADGSGHREMLARVKAVYNAKLVGESTVLGDPISIRNP